MAVERKTKNRRKLNEIQEKPTKEEYAVAKFLRFNVPVREGKLVGMAVQCFFANKAVDALLESKWSASKMKKEPLFTNRSSCVAYCNRLLQKGLFHRAERVQRSKDRDKSKRKKKLKEGEKEEESAEDTVRERKKKEKKGKKEGDGDKEEEEKEEAEKKEEKKPEKEEEKKKKEKKLRLNMSDDQWFVDGEEVYVWIYDPVPFKTFMIGLLMVLGAIALCLFPLWPEEVRIGVYYLSLAAAGFVGFILVLVVVRIILFCLVWVFTLGKHHFWFLPNLTEDVGFFDSFKPLYKHEYFGKDSEKEKSEKDVKSKGSTDTEKKKKTEEKKEKIEKEENSGSDKSENGEFEIVEKEELAEVEEEGEEAEEEINDEEEMNDEEDQEDDEDEENDFEDEDSEENTELKKEK